MGNPTATVSKQKLKRQFITIRYSDRKSPIQGYVIDNSNYWILLKQCPVDYVIDGYIIVSSNRLVDIVHEAPEKFKERIVILKGLQPQDRENVPLDDLKTILTHLTRKHKVFQLETKSEKACYLGRLKSIDSHRLTISYFDTMARWAGTRSFRLGDIRTIQFETDYINSLKLIAKL